MSDQRERGVNMRPPKRSKLPPGRQVWKRCHNSADMLVSLHQDNEHRRIGSGWFEVPMCNRCFDEGDDR